MRFLALIRISVFGALAVLALPVSAVAKGRVLAPPGNSGVSQYVESIPTAGGGKPTSSVHPVGGVSGGSGGGSGRSGSSAVAGGSGRGGSSAVAGGGTGGGAVSSSTTNALSRHGAVGRSAAAFAAATAPSRARRGHGAAGKAPGSAVPATSGTSGSSPAASVVDALTGSGTNGAGLGIVLPIILVATLVGASALALLRRRRKADL